MPSTIGKDHDGHFSGLPGFESKISILRLSLWVFVTLSAGQKIHCDIFVFLIHLGIMPTMSHIQGLKWLFTQKRIVSHFDLIAVGEIQAKNR